MVRVLVPLSLLLTLTIEVSLCAQQEPGQVTTAQGYAGFQPGFIVLVGQAVPRIPLELVLTVDGNPNPHGWYFTAPTFKDHLLEGQWTDDGMVLNGKNGERLSLSYMRQQHSSAKPGEPLSLYVVTTLTGTLLSRSGEQQLILQMDFTRPPRKNGRWYDFGPSDQEIEKNAQAFLRAVQQADARTAALYVDFPLTTFLENKAVKISGAQEFLRLYNEILPPGASDRAKMALPHDMFCRMGNAMVLNGEVSFSSKGAVSEWLSPKSAENKKIF